MAGGRGGRIGQQGYPAAVDVDVDVDVDAGGQ